MTARYKIIAAALFALIVNTGTVQAFATLTRNDPYPMYSTQNPYLFLSTPTRNKYRTYGDDEFGSWFQFSASGFYQFARTGKNIYGGTTELGDMQGGGTYSDVALARDCITIPFPNPGCTSTQTGFTPVTLPVSTSVVGGWNMVGLLYDPAAREVIRNLFCLEDQTAQTFIENSCNTDLRKEFGFFSVPIQYRKRGARFEAEFGLGCGLGIRAQTGVVNIRQNALFNDLTLIALGTTANTQYLSPQNTVNPVGTCPIQTSASQIEGFNCNQKRFVVENLMKKRYEIADALGLDISDFDNCSSMEDLRLSLFWRGIYPVNQERVNWPFFLFTPFFTINANCPTAKCIPRNKVLGLSAGNWGHWGVGINGGVSIDFVESIELIVEGGVMYFFDKRFSCYPVPTNRLQSVLYPRLADVNVKPGSSASAAVTINAYHFLDKLSFYAQYIAVHHCQDNFCVNAIRTLSADDTTTPADVLTCKMSRESAWDVQMVNLSFNYDIAPWVGLGLLWQVPLGRHNAYRSTTVLGSLVISY